jgi:UDP-glucose 4-epimerase
MQKVPRILLLGYGYIGQYIFRELNANGYDCTVVSRRIDEGSSNMIKGLYQNLSKDFLDSFSHVLWFAGHSSVPISNSDPVGAIENNVISLFGLVQKLRLSTRLIYASSASIYSDLAHTNPAVVSDGNLKSLNVYDASKKAFDLMVEKLDVNTVGLRMGTLCGISPRMRPELVFNAMNIAAIKNKVVNLSNGENLRSLLFLKDLFDLIIEQIETQTSSQKFLNAGSVNISMAEIAEITASFYDAEVINHGTSAAFSFQMDLNKSQSAQEKRKLLSLECAKFEREYVL